MKEFRFKEDRNLGVFVCSKVWEHGAPILRVSHNEDGDWQFLCGGNHADSENDAARIVCLEHVIERDPNVNEVADLCPLWFATRPAPGKPWRREDGMEDIVRANVAEHGWHIMGVTAGELSPAFSYTIGMYETLGVPELICVGLPSTAAAGILNHAGRLAREGATFKSGAVMDDLLEGFACQLKRVSKKNYDEFLGYANWYYKGHGYPVLQLVYPDRQGRFPRDDGVSDGLKAQQTALWRQRRRTSV